MPSPGCDLGGDRAGRLDLSGSWFAIHQRGSEPAGGGHSGGDSPVAGAQGLLLQSDVAARRDDPTSRPPIMASRLHSHAPVPMADTIVINTRPITGARRRRYMRRRACSRSERLSTAGRAGSARGGTEPAGAGRKHQAFSGRNRRGGGGVGAGVAGVAAGPAEHGAVDVRQFCRVTVLEVRTHWDGRPLSLHVQPSDNQGDEFFFLFRR